MPSRMITVQMDDTTINALSSSGLSLYAMKAVKTDLKNGYALVWIKITAFSQSTLLKWQDEYRAYSTQQTNITSGSVIAGQNAYPIKLGQTLSISQASGTGVVYNDGIANTIAINNKTATQFSCGIEQNTSGEGHSLCVVPLYGGMIDLFGLVDSVLLTIEATQREVNSAITQSTAPSLMVNMDGEPGRTVTYHINANWADNLEGWCMQIDAGTKLTPRKRLAPPAGMRPISGKRIGQGHMDQLVSFGLRIPSPRNSACKGEGAKRIRRRCCFNLIRPSLKASSC